MSFSTSLLPPYESARLQSLRHYDFLSAPPDDVFYALVALAAHVFSQPHALIALVEEHQVVFPVQHGAEQLAPVPRAQALCSSAVLAPHAVAYENLAVTARTGPDAPAIGAALAQGNSFYAAAPLRMPDGYSIGVLCLMGPQPRTFSTEEEEVLESIAGLASLALAVRHLCLATPELGAEEWDWVCERLRSGLAALSTQAHTLLDQYGAAVPVPAAVLAPLRQGLQALRIVLSE